MARAQTFADPGFAAETVVTMPQFQVVGMQWTSTGTMLIFQKNGLVRVFKNGALLPAAFVDFRGKVNTYDDRGMLGLAIDPDFQNNGYVYLAYVFESGSDPNDSGPKISRLTRVTADPANKDVALAGSEVILLDNIPADGGGHTAGTLRFAPDGTLFLANGDGSTASFANAGATGAQSIDSLRGKILRINSDGTAPAPPQTPNPFYDGTNSIRSKVWAYGLRNAFRYDFHPILGDLYACDVGWNAYEEVDHVTPGGNYGWPCYEGFATVPEYHDLFPATCNPPPANAIAPIYAYDRSQGSAVVGGAFYTGGVYPEAYTNNFFFSDYTGGWMRRLVLNPDGSIFQNLTFATNIGVPVSTEVGPDGFMYYADYVTGQIRRIRYNGPVAVARPTRRRAIRRSRCRSRARARSIPVVARSPISGTSTTAPPPPRESVPHLHDGVVQSYDAQLTVKNSSNVTSSAAVKVTVGSLPPTPHITSPADGTGVQPGQTVTFTGTATDPDQTIGAAGLHWECCCTTTPTSTRSWRAVGFSGSFVAEYHGVGTYSYELILTATDSSGPVREHEHQSPGARRQHAAHHPSNPSRHAGGGYLVGLGWTASTDASGVSAYRIERCTGRVQQLRRDRVGAGHELLRLGAGPSTTYRYRVRASDPTGNLSGYSNIATAQTTAGLAAVGLVAGYGFNESGGTNANDQSGNGKHRQS
jgi:glucose/arabinose dehydrogenase